MLIDTSNRKVSRRKQIYSWKEKGNFHIVYHNCKYREGLTVYYIVYFLFIYITFVFFNYTDRSLQGSTGVIGLIDHAILCLRGSPTHGLSPLYTICTVYIYSVIFVGSINQPGVLTNLNMSL